MLRPLGLQWPQELLPARPRGGWWGVALVLSQDNTGDRLWVCLGSASFSL